MRRIIVTRTFSKVYGLAGLRLGYGIASPKALQQMRKFAIEDSINAIVTQAAVTALADTDGLNGSVQRNVNDRQEFFNQAMARALKPTDSHANFVMMNTYHPADEVIEHFRQHKRTYISTDEHIHPYFSRSASGNAGFLECMGHNTLVQESNDASLTTKARPAGIATHSLAPEGGRR